MNSTKGMFPVTWKNIEKFNRRLPVKLDREQYDLAKMLRKPRFNDPFEAMGVIYDYIDRHNAYADGLVACKQGCSFCCHSEVGIYQVEADYIAKHVGGSAKKVAPDPTRTSKTWIDPNNPCPFLKDDACTVYKYRPMTCRTHLHFEATNEMCRFDSTVKNVPLIDRNKGMPGVMKAYAELVARYGGGGGDIRLFFGKTPGDNHE